MLPFLCGYRFQTEYNTGCRLHLDRHAKRPELPPVKSRQATTIAPLFRCSIKAQRLRETPPPPEVRQANQLILPLLRPVLVAEAAEAAVEERRLPLARLPLSVWRRGRSAGQATSRLKPRSRPSPSTKSMTAFAIGMSALSSIGRRAIGRRIGRRQKPPPMTAHSSTAPE